MRKNHGDENSENPHEDAFRWFCNNTDSTKNENRYRYCEGRMTEFLQVFELQQGSKFALEQGFDGDMSRLSYDREARL